jgi:hypothetical protein
MYLGTSTQDEHNQNYAAKFMAEQESCLDCTTFADMGGAHQSRLFTVFNVTERLVVC